MIDIDPALRSTLGFHIGYEKDSMHAKLAGTLRQIGNFGEGMVPEPRPKLANFTYSCQPSIEARCGLQINSSWLPEFRRRLEPAVRILACAHIWRRLIVCGLQNGAI